METGTGRPERGIVFVVEDDPLVQRAIARLLRTAGHRVETFDTVGAFLRRRVPAEPACVVLDLHLPDGNGLEVLERLAERDLPIAAVVLTAHGDVPTTVRAMRTGALELHEKPVDNDRLLEVVEEGLSRSADLRRRQRRRRRLSGRLGSLSPRQRQVFELVVVGRANKEIAARLGISEKTVKAHRGEVMRRMKADSLADLVRISTEMEAGGAGGS